MKKLIEEDYENEPVEDRKLSKLSVSDLSALYIAYKNSSMLKDIDTDKLLMFWLTFRKIEFSVKSEFNVELETLKNENYLILNRW